MTAPDDHFRRIAKAAQRGERLARRDAEFIISLAARLRRGVSLAEAFDIARPGQRRSGTFYERDITLIQAAGRHFGDWSRRQQGERLAIEMGQQVAL